jgi:hypothetical protein
MRRGLGDMDIIQVGESSRYIAWGIAALLFIAVIRMVKS